MVTYIYLIENIEIGVNKVYIGKTICTNVNNRRYSHRQIYGKQIHFTIIDEVDSLVRSEWRYIESYWIEQFKQWGFKVVNKNKGGGGPEYCTEDTRHKMKNSPNRLLKLKNNLERNHKISVSMKKYQRTQEHNNKIKNRIYTLSHINNISKAKSKSITQYNKQGEYIADYNSIKKAADTLKVNYQNLSNHVRKYKNYNKTIGGYIFKFKN
jgi:hypothetical protein